MKVFRADILLTLLVLGAYLFTRGFFLTRLEVRVRSTCDAPPSVIGSDLAESGCWLPKARFRRLVLLIIDGWRFDFAAGSPPSNVDASSIGEELSEAQLKMIRGHMPKLERMLRHGGGGVDSNGRHSAQLYRFVADPPTVTMQRLKGLTSGSLPTFIDAGANFASSAVEEDNLVSQIANAAASARSIDSAHDPALIFLGDDTWTGLFPTQFTVSRPFPSFDVRDLHTVDDGVLRYLLPALHCGAAGVQAVDNGTLTADGLLSAASPRCPHNSVTDNSRDWRLLVGHFLGVDHVGHRFSTPAHAAMARKLGQMDEAIERVAAALDEETLLVVMGDHGMTSVGGNHGGASAEEVTAALFMYAQTPGLFLAPHHAAAPATAAASDETSSTAADRDYGDDPTGSSRDHGSGGDSATLQPVRTVAQTDIVPTLALLLGLPIPYASLGAVLPDVNFAALAHQAADVEKVAAAALASLARSAGDVPDTDTQVTDAGGAGAASTLHDALAVAASAAAHHVNAHQLLRYLRTYNGVAGTFAAHEVDALAETVAAGDAGLEASLKGLLVAAQTAANACRSAGGDDGDDAGSDSKPQEASAGDVARSSRLRRSDRRAAATPPTAPEADTQVPGGIPGLLRAIDDAVVAAGACSAASAGQLASTGVLAATQQFAAAREHHRGMLLRAAALCRALWTRFDEPSMVAGLGVMAAAILLSLWVVFDAEARRRSRKRDEASAAVRNAVAAGAAALPLCSRRARKLALCSLLPPLCFAAAVWPQSMAVGAANTAQAAVAAIRTCVIVVLPGATPLLPGVRGLLDSGIRSCSSAASYARSAVPMVWLGAGSGSVHNRTDGGDAAASVPAGFLADAPRELWLAAGLVVAFLIWPSAPPTTEQSETSTKQASVPAVLAGAAIDAAATAVDRKPDGATGLRNRRAVAGAGASAAVGSSAADAEAASAKLTVNVAYSNPPVAKYVLPLPSSAGSAVFGGAALLLLALRLDGLFTNSFIVAEASVAAHLLCAALLLCWAAACRAALVRLQQQSTVSSGSKDAVAAARRRAFAACAAATVMVVVCLLCTRATLQRDGWLWPFPPSDVVASTAATAGDGGVDVAASSFAEIGSAANLTASAAAGSTAPLLTSATPVPRVETGTGKSSIGWQMELPLLPLQALQSPPDGATGFTTDAAAAMAGGDEDPPATGSGPSLPRWLLSAVHLAAPTVLLAAAAAVDAATKAATATIGVAYTAPSISALMTATITRLRALPAIAVAAAATLAQLLVACFWRGQQVAVPVTADAAASLNAAGPLFQLLWTGRSSQTASAQSTAPSHSLLEASPLLRLALPRIVYAATLCGLAVAAALALSAWRARSRVHHPGLCYASDKSSVGGAVVPAGLADAGASPKLLLRRMLVYVVLLPSLSLLLGPGSPVVLAAMGLHALCLAGLRALSAPEFKSESESESESKSESESESTSRGAQLGPSGDTEGAGASASGAAGGAGAAQRGTGSRCSRAGAAALALLTSPLACHSLCLSWSALHYYLASGHGNQFNSLHFAAPFVGFDSYSPLVSSALMALNTLAAHIVFFAVFGGGLMSVSSLPSTAPSHRSSHLAESTEEHSHAHSSDDVSSDADSAPALALLLPNALAFACTAAFCCIARRHLMVWAIFAPKFCFDALHLAAATAAAVALRLGVL